MESSCIPHTQFSLLVTSCISMVHLSQQLHQCCYIILAKAPYLIEISQFSLVSFFFSRIPSRMYQATFTIHVSFGPLGFDNFRDFSFFWVTLTILKSMVRYFVECSPVELCLMLLSWLDCQRGKVPFSLHIKSTYCQHDLPLLVTLITWLKCRVIIIFYCKLTFPPSFPCSRRK